jgi:hypothetical protein
MIELTEKAVGIWYVQVTPMQDWMAALVEIEPGKYDLKYRHRYYAEENNSAWDGQDRKSWYTGTVTASREAAIAGLREVGQKLAALAKQDGNDTSFDEILNEGDYDAFLQKVMDAPWAHSKTIDSTDN